MGRLRNFFSKLAAPWAMAAMLGERGWHMLLGSGSGLQEVGEKDMLTVSTYFQCIRNISEDVSKLPFRLVKNVGKTREPLENDPLTLIIAVAPNPWMSAYTFWCTFLSHMVGWGNAYAEIVRNPRGGIGALYPIHPSRVMIERRKDGAVSYKIRNNDGSFVAIPSEQMFHVFGMSPDGVVGYSIPQLMQNTLTLANTVQNFAKHFYANSARPSGVLTTEAVLTPVNREALRKAWNDAYTGPENAGKTVLMDGGAKFAAISMPLKDAEFIELRSFQKTEIAGWFRMPLYKLQEIGRAQGWSTLDAQETDYVNSCLMPWIRRIECEIKRQLMQGYAPEVYAHIETKGLLRGDLKARTEFLKALFDRGIITPNEWRELEDMLTSDAPGMDEHYINSTMIPLSKAGQTPAPKPTKPDQEPDDEDDKENAAA